MKSPYLITGSVGAMAYGESRLINDIDIVVGVEIKHVKGLVKAFASEEFYISEERLEKPLNVKNNLILFTHLLV